MTEPEMRSLKRRVDGLETCCHELRRRGDELEICCQELRRKLQPENLKWLVEDVVKAELRRAEYAR